MEGALQYQFSTPSLANHLWPEASSNGFLEGTPKSYEENWNEKV